MSDPAEPSPKRQRRSFSPASPLPDAAAVVQQPPQTPPPSVRMSPSCQTAQLSGLVGQQHSAAAAAAAPASNHNTFPTPPSTAVPSSQAMARGASSDGLGGESARQTPVPEARDDDGDAQPDATDDDVEMTEGEDHRRSDHERQEAEDTVPPLPGANVLYKLSTEPIAPVQPLFSRNVIELYGMQHVQASVARKDAATGAKINKLRKSYDGKVKELGLEGRNKAAKQEGWFTGFLHPGWDVVLDDGRTMWQLDKADSIPGDPASDQKIFGLLDKALDMRPGRMPNHEFHEWKNLLGLDDATAVAAARLPSALPTASPSRVASSSFLPRAATATPTSHDPPGGVASERGDALRPDRQGKKRRYDEHSYEGYDKGYDDDGYSTGGGGLDDGARRTSASKRQKRRVSLPPA